jgi:hypothetical protein
MNPLWRGIFYLSSSIRWDFTNYPSQTIRFPYYVPVTTFPSGSSYNAETSESSSWPNFAISPYSFNPVNVLAIFQNLIWPWPHVNKMSSVYGENYTL